MQLVNGAMELILKSNQKKHIIKDRFHDGEWHMVSIGQVETCDTSFVGSLRIFLDGVILQVNVTKKARRLAFSVGKKSKTLSIPNKLNVQHAFYMGNVSSLFKPRRPPKFVSNYVCQENDVDVTEFFLLMSLDFSRQPIIPFRGCIRDFKINNTRQDLSANAQNVGQCFLKVEGGSRFGGDAFAIYGT